MIKSSESSSFVRRCFIPVFTNKKTIFIIKKFYYNESYEFIELIKRNFSDEVIEILVNNFEDDVIESSFKHLVIKFLIERKNRIIEIYNQGKEANYE